MNRLPALAVRTFRTARSRYPQRRLESTSTANTASTTAPTTTATPTTSTATAAATANARASYRWLISGIAVPLGLGLLLDRLLAPNAPLGTGIALITPTATTPAGQEHAARRLLEEESSPKLQPEHEPGLHETTGPLVDEALAGGVGAHILNEQAKMWTCLWGMTGEAPCSFPII